MVESARRIVSHQVQDDKALISGRTRKAVVVQLCRLLIKKYRHGVKLIPQSSLQVGHSLWANGGAGPSIPEESHIIVCKSL